MFLQPISAVAISPSAMASSRTSRLPCRRRSTGMAFRPILMATRCAPVVTPAWRRIEAARCGRARARAAARRVRSRHQGRQPLAAPAASNPSDAARCAIPPAVRPRPVEIVDEWVTIPRPACWRGHSLQHRFRTRQHRIDGGQLSVERAGMVIPAISLPLSGRLDGHRGAFGLKATFFTN